MDVRLRHLEDEVLLQMPSAAIFSSYPFSQFVSHPSCCPVSRSAGWGRGTSGCVKRPSFFLALGGDLESRVGSPGHEDRTLSRKGGALHVGQYKGYCAASFYALRTGSL